MTQCPLCSGSGFRVKILHTPEYMVTQWECECGYGWWSRTEFKSVGREV